jgi:AraC family transcriptional regulator, exoenzyme S synthesis regulatory protein ExsA
LDMDSLYDFVTTNPEAMRQFSCKGVLFLKIDCPRTLKLDDWNAHNLFIHVLNGSKCLYTREKSWHLKVGSTFFVKKGAITVEKIGDDPLCALMFFVPDNYIRCFVKENKSLISGVLLNEVTSDQVIPVSTTPVMQAFYESVISYFESGKQPAENLLELKFRELLLNIITTESNKILIHHFCKLAQEGVDDLMEVMENNSLYNLELRQYARLCNRSLSKFKRDFTAAFNETPGRWLLQRRLEHARRLLIQTDKQIIEVALESGFTNVTHFDRVFKEYTGISPMKYRKGSAVIAG